MAPFLVSSGHLLVRNVSVMLTWILASSLAVRLGTVAAAAHQILSQVFWLAAFVPEAFTPVAQVLIARSEGEGVPRALEYAQRIMRVRCLQAMNTLEGQWLPCQRRGHRPAGAVRVGHLSCAATRVRLGVVP